MASVETVTHYSHGNNIAQEAAHEIPERKPAAEWPREGAVEVVDREEVGGDGVCGARLSTNGRCHC